MSDSREAFEVWAEIQNDDKDCEYELFLSEDDKGHYVCGATHTAYLAFKAGRASRQSLSSCSENPNSSATGNAVAMGDLTDEEGDLHKKSILIQFSSVEDFGAAVKSGQCRFTVFGSGV